MIRELTKNDLYVIVCNLAITKHSRERNKERNGVDTSDFIVRTILSSDFAFYCGNGDYNIKIGNSEKYFVIHKNYNENIYHLITIKQLSWGGKTIREKYELLRAKENMKKHLTNKNESNKIELRRN